MNKTVLLDLSRPFRKFVWRVRLSSSRYATGFPGSIIGFARTWFWPYQHKKRFQHWSKVEWRCFVWMLISTQWYKIAAHTFYLWKPPKKIALTSIIMTPYIWSYIYKVFWRKLSLQGRHIIISLSWSWTWWRFMMTSGLSCVFIRQGLKTE